MYLSTDLFCFRYVFHFCLFVSFRFFFLNYNADDPYPPPPTPNPLKKINDNFYKNLNKRLYYEDIRLIMLILLEWQSIYFEKAMHSGDARSCLIVLPSNPS
jgi:hypothetical protein